MGKIFGNLPLTEVKNRFPDFSEAYIKAHQQWLESTRDKDVFRYLYPPYPFEREELSVETITLTLWRIRVNIIFGKIEREGWPRQVKEIYEQKY